MLFQSFDDRFILRLESGEEVIATLTAFLREQGIKFADVSAIGAVTWIQLGYWNADSRSYEYREFDEQMEVLSLRGNSSEKNGEPFLHLHVVLGRRDFSTLGGHLKEARVHPTLEVWLLSEEIAVRRGRDEASGLILLDLPERFEKRDAR